MNKSSLALAVAVGVLAQQAGAAGFVEDSKLSLSSRTMYFDNDNRYSLTPANNRGPITVRLARDSSWTTCRVSPKVPWALV